MSLKLGQPSGMMSRLIEDMSGFTNEIMTHIILTELLRFNNCEIYNS